MFKFGPKDGGNIYLRSVDIYLRVTGLETFWIWLLNDHGFGQWICCTSSFLLFDGSNVIVCYYIGSHENLNVTYKAKDVSYVSLNYEHRFPMRNARKIRELNCSFKTPKQHICWLASLTLQWNVIFICRSFMLHKNVWRNFTDQNLAINVFCTCADGHVCVGGMKEFPMEMKISTQSGPPLWPIRRPIERSPSASPSTHSRCADQILSPTFLVPFYTSRWT